MDCNANVTEINRFYNIISRRYIDTQVWFLSTIQTGYRAE